MKLNKEDLTYCLEKVCGWIKEGIVSLSLVVLVIAGWPIGVVLTGLITGVSSAVVGAWEGWKAFQKSWKDDILPFFQRKFGGHNLYHKRLVLGSRLAFTLLMIILIFLRQSFLTHKKQKRVQVEQKITNVKVEPLSEKERFDLGKKFHGAGAWIYKLRQAEGGDADRIIARCLENDLTYVMVKTSEGAGIVNHRSKWSTDTNEPMQLTKGFVEKLNQAGIACHAWSFVIGNQPDIEAELIIRALHDVGANGFVFNTEGAVKNKSVNAEAICRKVREHLDACERCQRKKLAYSPFRNPYQHRALPYDVFGKYCDYMMPQLYWWYPNSKRDPVRVFNSSYAQWVSLQKEWVANGKEDSIKPVIPIVQTMHGAPCCDIERWLVVGIRYHGFNLYQWGTTSNDQWQTIRRWRKIQKVYQKKNARLRL